MEGDIVSKSMREIEDIKATARVELGKEAQAYHDLTVQGDPERAFFAYLYYDKRPNVKFILSFADIVTRLGAAWSPALRAVYFRMARMGRLLISTFHKPPGAHIMRLDEDDETPYQTYDTESLRQWTSRKRADKFADELDSAQDYDEGELEFEEED